MSETSAQKSGNGEKNAKSGKNEKSGKSVKKTVVPIQPGLKVLSAELETVCGVTTAKFPDNADAEFAFAGKSNVGKSSLINALMQRRALARTSSTPGKTQTINYYKVNDAFYLVDLPGYGFTRISPEVKAKWGRMVERYLAHTKTLCAVFLLVDMRHKPTADDCMMYDWIVHNGFAPIVIATKQDKLKKTEQEKAKKLIRETLGMKPDGILIPFSAETKAGREEIYSILKNGLHEMNEMPDANVVSGSFAT